MKTKEKYAGSMPKMKRYEQENEITMELGKMKIRRGCRPASMQNEGRPADIHGMAGDGGIVIKRCETVERKKT